MVIERREPPEAQVRLDDVEIRSESVENHDMSGPRGKVGNDATRWSERLRGSCLETGRRAADMILRKHVIFRKRKR